MYSKLALFVASVFAVGALAAPGGEPVPAGGINVSQCDVGNLQCCKQVQSANNHEVQTLAGILGVTLGSLTGQVGLTCTAILGGNSCTAQTVCCKGNNFQGLLVAGCVPYNFNI